LEFKSTGVIKGGTGKMQSLIEQPMLQPFYADLKDSVWISRNSTAMMRPRTPHNESWPAAQP
jgi:hypothetical protein